MTDHVRKDLPHVSLCSHCHRATFPVKHICPRCGGRSLSESPISDEAEVFSHTTIPRDAGGDFRIALVVTSGVRLVVAVSNEVGVIAVGTRLRLRTRSEAPGYEAGQDGAPVVNNAVRDSR